MVCHRIAPLSGLYLARAKGVLIHLWRTPLIRVKDLLQDLIPLWANVFLQRERRYLGFVIGPGVVESSSWKKPLAALLDRPRYIKAIGLSFQQRIW